MPGSCRWRMSSKSYIQFLKCRSTTSLVECVWLSLTSRKLLLPVVILLAMALSLGLATNVPFVAHAQPVDTTSTTVVCSPNLIAPGAVSICTATVTDTAGTGYVPTGNVTFTSSSTAVGTVNNICFLSAAALCSVNFTGVG